MAKAKYDNVVIEGRGKLDISYVDKKVDYILAVMIGVIIVMFVGFMTLLVMVAQMVVTYKANGG
jgi:hypothetical protein